MALDSCRPRAVEGCGFVPRKSTAQGYTPGSGFQRSLSPSRQGQPTWCGSPLETELSLGRQSRAAPWRTVGAWLPSVAVDAFRALFGLASDAD